jgi:hypothetical protein
VNTFQAADFGLQFHEIRRVSTAKGFSMKGTDRDGLSPYSSFMSFALLWRAFGFFAAMLLQAHHVLPVGRQVIICRNNPLFGFQFTINIR